MVDMEALACGFTALKNIQNLGPEAQSSGPGGTSIELWRVPGRLSTMMSKKGVFGASRGPLGAILGRHGAVLARSWGVMGRFWVRLCGLMGCPDAVMGRSWGRFAAILGRLDGILDN